MLKEMAKMIYCYPKTHYYVSCRWHTHHGGSRNYICTPSLGKARYHAKRLPRNIRQIDVRTKNSKPYVLHGSWL